MEQLKRLKFTNKDKSKFFGTLKENVDKYFEENNLSKHANAQMKWKTVILLSAFILPYVSLLVFHQNFGFVLLNFAIMGVAMAGIGMSVMHDANHNAYSANPRVNFLVGSSLNLIGGFIANWKVQHNVLHHTYTNIHGHDNDIESLFLMRFSPHDKLRKFHRLQHFYVFFFYSILTLYWIVAKDIIQLIKYRRNGASRASAKEHRKSAWTLFLTKGLYFFYIIVTPIVFFDYSVGQIIAGFVLMHLICGLILSTVFQLAHVVQGTAYPQANEKSEVENDWAIHQMHTTVNFARKSKVVSWYLGGLNFQVEHHLFPYICHVHYPAISEIVKKTAEEHGVPYLDNPTFGNALVSHIRLLKHLGRHEDLNPATA